MPVRHKIFLTSIYLFTAVLFFPSLQTLNFLITAVLVISALSFNSFREKIAILKQRKVLWWMLIFILLIFISIWLSNNKHSAFRYLDSRLPLLYFPLSIGLISISKELRKKALLGTAAIITIASLACIGYGIYRSYHFHNTAFLYNDALSEPVTGLQSIYVSLLVNLAIYIFTWFLFYEPLFRYKTLLVAAVLFLFVTSFLLASRNLMLVLYASTLAFAFYHIIKRKKYLEGATLIMGLLIGVFLIVKFFPKTINRFKELTYTKFSYQKDGAESHYDMALDSTQWNGANTRIAIWQCGWQLFRQHPLLGVHLGDKKLKLMEVYREKNFEFAIRTQKNLHNNYLDILVSLGISGLLIFLISWLFLPLRIAWQYRDGLAIIIMLTFAIAMVTENYFDRSIGGMLFGFFIPFLLSDKTAKN